MAEDGQTPDPDPASSCDKMSKEQPSETSAKKDKDDTQTASNTQLVGIPEMEPAPSEASSKSLERMSKSKIKEESVDELSTTLCKPIQQPSRPISPDVPAADTIADVRSVRRQHTFCETLTSDQALLDGYDTCGSSIFEEDEMPELDPGAKSGTASPLPGRGRQGSRSSKTAFLALMGENTLNNLQVRTCCNGCCRCCCC
eukprot:scpid97474/ scgid0838/ 